MLLVSLLFVAVINPYILLFKFNFFVLNTISDMYIYIYIYIYIYVHTYIYTYINIYYIYIYMRLFKKLKIDKEVGIIVKSKESRVTK